MWFRTDILSPGYNKHWKIKVKTSLELWRFSVRLFEVEEKKKNRTRKDVKANIQYFLWIIMKQIEQIAPVKSCRFACLRLSSEQVVKNFSLRQQNCTVLKCLLFQFTKERWSMSATRFLRLLYTIDFNDILLFLFCSNRKKISHRYVTLLPIWPWCDRCINLSELFTVYQISIK